MEKGKNSKKEGNNKYKPHDFLLLNILGQAPGVYKV